MTEAYDYEEPRPDQRVNVFIVSRNSRHVGRRVLWQMTREDAMKVCSDERTGPSVTPNSMLVFDGSALDDAELNRFVEDNGRYAAVLAELGVTVLDSLALRLERGEE